MTEITEEQRMQPEVLQLLEILRRHPGKHKAIGSLDLYEQWSGEKVPRDPATHKPAVDVQTLTRAMRNIIDDLRNVYRIPVMSSTAHGYWIITSQDELNDVVHEFQSRGLKSLQTAARLKQTSLVDAVQQLAMDLQNNDSPIRKRVEARTRKPDCASTGTDLGELILSPEARMAVITSHLQEMLGSPQEYADQIRSLQRQFGPRLLPESVMHEITRQAGIARETITRAVDAVNRLEHMVGGQP